MKTISIKGNLREFKTKNSAKALRREGRIPAVLYGIDENYSFSTTLNEVKSIIYTPDFKLAEIELNGESHTAILKDIQFHPVTEDVMHLDFLKLSDGVKVKIEVPVRFQGTSPGEKEGGKLIPSLRKVKIQTTPEHLVDELTADISKVQLGQTIRVKDLEINENIDILNQLGIPVASVKIPRLLKIDAPEEALEETEEELAEGEERAEEDKGEDKGES